MGRKCQILTHRKNSHSKFSQTVTSKQWRCRKLSETVAGTSANNVGSHARTHKIQTICRQRTQRGSFLVSEVARYSPHSIVPWADRTVENWWSLEKQFLHIFQRSEKGFGNPAPKLADRWKPSVWLGKSDLTDEHLVRTDDGVM